MNPKYRILYLLLGALGFAGLVYYVVASLPDTNAGIILLITVPDMVFFFLAYKTYPEEEHAGRYIKSN